MRLQELVDKFQLKIKAYKRQAEEAVSDFSLRRSNVYLSSHLQTFNHQSFRRLTGGAGQHSPGQAEEGAARAGGGGGASRHRRVAGQQDESEESRRGEGESPVWKTHSAL